MEETVVGVYDLGVMDKKVLSVLLEPYRECDIDHGGERGLKTKDGLGADDVIIKFFDPKSFVKLQEMKKIIDKHPKKLSAKQEAFEEKYWEQRFEAVHKITYKKFRWR